MRNILLTRPWEDSLLTAATLESRGYNCSISPMLHIAALDPLPPVEILSLQAAIVTSRHAIPALRQWKIPHTLPIFAVGNQTAKNLAKAGFAHVHTSSTGDAAGLISLITAHCKKEDGTLLYPSALQVQHDFALLLQQGGYNARRVAVYEARTAEGFASEALDALTSRHIDGAVFTSRRAATRFAALIAQHGLTQNLAACAAYCLSRNIAQPIAQLPWKHIEIAPKPNMDALLELLQ